MLKEEANGGIKSFLWMAQNKSEAVITTQIAK